MSATGAAFVTALVLLPLHRAVDRVVGQVIDRERYVLHARVQQFVSDVRDGHTEPETIQDVLRNVLTDPGLKLPDSRPGQYVDLFGAPTDSSPEAVCIPLRSGITEVGMMTLSAASARRVRRAKDMARAARLPIEVTRLRLELRAAISLPSALRAGGRTVGHSEAYGSESTASGRRSSRRRSASRGAEGAMP
ncbi:hypothetical protein AB5J55_43405 [Streptomyces sp. R11]|uniref:Uncharacterized protein n=1 Tax=Streptomyces sp. R11 TaxID=3238625 RepID=A0AB39NCF5_9ACTN